MIQPALRILALRILALRILALRILIVGTMMGCHASIETPPPPTGTESETTTYRAPSRARTEAEHVRDRALAIQRANDRIEEAAAIQRLVDYFADRKLIFNVTAQRAIDYSPLASPLSASPDRMRVRVDVYRGQQPIQSFTFIPRDNRNLALLGQ
jgi:hypothetical protein